MIWTSKSVVNYFWFNMDKLFAICLIMNESFVIESITYEWIICWKTHLEMSESFTNDLILCERITRDQLFDHKRMNRLWRIHSKMSCYLFPYDLIMYQWIIPLNTSRSRTIRPHKNKSFVSDSLKNEWIVHERLDVIWAIHSRTLWSCVSELSKSRLRTIIPLPPPPWISRLRTIWLNVNEKFDTIPLSVDRSRMIFAKKERIVRQWFRWMNILFMQTVTSKMSHLKVIWSDSVDRPQIMEPSKFQNFWKNHFEYQLCVDENFWNSFRSSKNIFECLWRFFEVLSARERCRWTFDLGFFFSSIPSR